MTDAVLAGIHHVKLPVTDLARSQEWYERVLGFVAEYEFPDDRGVVRGVAGQLPGLGESGFALRENPAVARGISGFDPVCFAIADQTAAQAWAARFDELGIEHSPIIETPVGWIVSVNDPDGTELRFYSWARPENPPAPGPGDPMVRRVSDGSLHA